MLGNDENQIERLLDRLEALLGWVELWTGEEYGRKLREIYKKRNDIIHRAQYDIANMEDVLLTDEIIFNVLVNIAAHPKIFSDKNSIIRFAEKVKAEQLLGIKSRTRPKTLTYIGRAYNERDREAIA